MTKIILILGGARSGKSTYAEELAKQLGGDAVLYVATSEVKDEEMQQRVEKHRTVRPPAWRTVEAQNKLGEKISKNLKDEKVVLIDCLTLFVSNTLLETTAPLEDAFDPPSADPFDPEIEDRLMQEMQILVKTYEQSSIDMIVVSNEVGLGLVPPYELGRAYRDMLGRANQFLASQVDEVVFLVAGIPMKIKSEIR
jgi:adenosylcobinamide kinase/adenosylcobinamide-phosphate guanylyltransferase